MAIPYNTARILVIDDHALMRLAVGETLSADGMPNFIEAASCEEALELMRTRQFDLIITDTSIRGGMSGIDFTQIIRANAALQPQPVIIGMSTDTLADAYKEMGAEDFWLKGSAPELLTKAVKTQLDRRPAPPAPGTPAM